MKNGRRRRPEIHESSIALNITLKKMLDKIRHAIFYIIETRCATFWNFSVKQAFLPTPCPSQEGNLSIGSRRIPLLGGARGGFSYQVAHRVKFMLGDA